MNRFITSLLVIVLTTSLLQAQNNETDPYIEVTGSSEMSVIPDIIVYTVELQEYEKDRSLVPMELIEGKFLEAVRASNISPQHINVSDISASSFKVKRKRKAFAKKTYNLTFFSPKELIDFIDRLENVIIQEQFVSRLDHTQMTKFRLDTKKRALEAARNKASALLTTVDSSLGKPLIIKEIDPARTFARRNPASNSAYTVPGNNFGYEVEFAPLLIRFEVLARFAIQ